MAKTVSTAVMSSQPAANDKTNDCGLASGGIRKVNSATGGGEFSVVAAACRSKAKKAGKARL